MSSTIAFTGGGTAGHVFPALAVAERLAGSRAGRVVWIGSLSGIERQILARMPIRYYGIPAGKLRRYFSWRNFIDLFNILAGILASLAVLIREKPALLFSKGGFVSVPPVLAASLLRIPVFTHESDVNPGLATRINARFAEKILVSFRESVELLSRPRRWLRLPGPGRVVWTGNPVRSELLAGDRETGRRLVGCPADRRLLLVLGGSLGSSRINRLVAEVLEPLTRACFVVHQMGDREFRAAGRPGYHPAPFFREELPHLLRAADLVVSRAGANILWELAALGLPSLLIPLSLEASRGDQIENAEVFSRAGAAEVLPEEEATGEKLLQAVCRLLDDEEGRRRMGECARRLGNPGSADRIAGLILERTGWRVGAGQGG
jgi:UDP-N-acetylglucosamine--N-acetylmuramyl-(pentapeptide) pyrophosphoryl-undecaprenol N-acetylglucosamine transferase